ncbi:hypothetical protein ACFO26_02205 [Lactococcus nasutitermitis]|uniref:Uncharacterized protein n=1 Tax=Lactococcus nasutitermitis TaxID=1652957 RepID=A0ABV9JBA0_9LACT|nr:hypothetical protein [Lactococcus nasutitermitis]
MKIKNIKFGHLIIMFIIWLGTMFLPATVNENKIGMTFRIEKSRANFFYLIFYQFPVYSVSIIVLLLITLLFLAKKVKLASYFAFSSFMIYIFTFLIIIPFSFFLKDATTSKELLWNIYVFEWYHGINYWIVFVIGLIFMLLLFLYSYSEKKSL